MIKRITKLTGLLLACASVTSSIPVMADDVKKIESQEGTVYSAMAYYTDSGVFYIDAAFGDEDEAVYCIKNGQCTKMENIKPGDDITDVVDDRYLEMNYGDYYVDINSGEKSYDIVNINNHNKARTLKNKIKKDNDGRFEKSEYSDGNINEPGKKFDGCTWNEYQYKLEKPQVFGDYIKNKSFVYADKEGNYFDGDYNLGKLGVEITTGCAVTVSDKEVILKDSYTKIKNTEDTYKVEDVNGNKYEIKALVTEPYNICKTDKYLFRTVNLSIWIKERNADDSEYINITDKVKFGSKNRNYSAPLTFSEDYGNYTKVTQKMSIETADDNIDGIKYPKNSTIYLTTDEDGEDKTSDMFMYYNDGFTWEPDFEKKQLKARSVNYKTKEGYNYIELGDIDNTDVDISNFYDMWNPVTIGAAGLCCVNDGYVKKFIPSEDKFVNLYQVDRDMNRINVCWQYTLIVWNQENGYYTIIDEPVPWMMQNTSETESNAATEEYKNPESWVKADDGSWSYIKADGTKAVGWLKHEKSWYYLNKSGIMQTGWINDNGKWYYCDLSGSMLADTTIDGYILGSDGAWIK